MVSLQRIVSARALKAKSDGLLSVSASEAAAPDAVNQVHRFARSVLSEALRYSDEVEGGRFTESHGRELTRSAASQAMAKLAEVRSAVARAKGYAAEAANQRREAVRRREGEATALEVARAIESARLLRESKPGDKTAEQIAAGIRAGDRDAVLAGLALPGYGPFADIATRARARLVEITEGEATAQRWQRLEVGAQIAERQAHELEMALREMAQTGRLAKDIGSAHELVTEGNDAGKQDLLRQAEQLGILDPVPEPQPQARPSGEPKSPARDLMQRANVAAMSEAQ